MNTRDIDLNLLVAFEALLAERNVTRAAHRQGVTQPAMSNSLRRLRVLLHDPVFVRTSEGMSPTPRALAIGPGIEAALNSIRANISATGFDPRRSVARFVLGTLDYIEALHLPAFIGKLEQTAPGVRLQVQRLAAIYDVPQLQLESGALDFAFGLFPQPVTPGSSLHAHILRQEDWVCIARKDHPTFRRRLSLKAYAGLKHLSVRYPQTGGGSGMVDRQLAAHDLTRICPASVPHFTTLPFHVAQSDCVTTLPRGLARFFAGVLPLRMAELPLAMPPTNVSLIWHSRVESDPAHRWFRKMLIETLR